MKLQCPISSDKSFKHSSIHNFELKTICYCKECQEILALKFWSTKIMVTCCQPCPIQHWFCGAVAIFQSSASVRPHGFWNSCPITCIHLLQTAQKYAHNTCWGFFSKLVRILYRKLQKFILQPFSKEQECMFFLQENIWAELGSTKSSLFGNRRHLY